jgi:6-phosphogluconate dehydrogenase (decarboxylating)
VSKLQMPRVVWVMLPAGEITETCLASLEFGA